MKTCWLGLDSLERCDNISENLVRTGKPNMLYLLDWVSSDLATGDIIRRIPGSPKNIHQLIK